MKVIKPQRPDPSIEWTDFGGLDLQPDELSRPFNSWRRAENVDLFIPGAVRKVVGPLLFHGPFPATIVEMINYLRAAGQPLLKLGVGSDGHLYNLDSVTDLATLGTVSAPWVAVFPGTAAGGAKIQYLVCTQSSGPLVKWESVGGVTAVGVSVPLGGVTVTTTQSAVNANAYLMQVGIQYLWTYWNPDTLHESSPSPVPTTAIITPTVNQPATATPYLTQVKLDIPTPNPAIGNGYTRIRVYRTQDGGATFFLLPHLYNAAGVDQLDANGSALRTAPTSTFYDGVAASNLAPAPDQLMVNPPGGAPAPDGNNPPPPNPIWGAVYQSRMWLLDSTGRRIWFSNIGDFQSYGIFNFFDFSKDIDDVITAIEALSDRLICFGKNSARQITGTDFSDFVEVPVDVRRGCVGRRAAISDGDVIYLLTPQSIARLAFSQAGPPFIGDKIKPLTDTIDPLAYLSTVVMEIDTTRSQMLFAVKINGVTGNDQIIVTDLGRESPFTLIKGLPSEVLSINELESQTGAKDVYISCVDRNVYKLHGGNGSLVATLETQKLPLTEWNLWRVFKKLDFFGSDLDNWLIAASADGVNFGAQVAMGIPLGSLSTKLGVAGRSVVLQFQHKVNNGVGALISRMWLTYEDKMGGF